MQVFRPKVGSALAIRTLLLPGRGWAGGLMASGYSPGLVRNYVGFNWLAVVHLAGPSSAAIAYKSVKRAPTRRDTPGEWCPQSVWPT